MEEVQEFIKMHYPDMENDKIASATGISIHQVRRIATKWGLRKSKEFLDRKREKVKKAQQEYFQKRIKQLSPTKEQMAIIYGSLLGDATLSRGPRSKHSAYKEHFSEQQRAYREWKQQALSDLGFHITQTNHLYSYSHPLFTELHSQFYQNGVKIIPENLLPQMTHPLFLTTLFLDDGSLILSKREAHTTLFLHPAIVIYTQCFTRVENELLKDHINHSFGTNFVITSRPDGHGFILKLNKEHEVQHFLRIVHPYLNTLPSMRYKTDLNERLRMEQEKRTDKQVVLCSSEKNRHYSLEEIELLAQLYRKGLTWSDIASHLDRSYWSVIYKSRQLGITKK